jgi:acetate kinase
VRRNIGRWGEAGSAGAGVDDHAVVLNAGSSSLGFSVYRRLQGDGWRLDARGQIAGIGTSPRLAVRDGAGETVADQRLDEPVSDGHGALTLFDGA